MPTPNPALTIVTTIITPPSATIVTAIDMTMLRYTPMRLSGLPRP
jgi:hypothetical protein